MIGNVILPDTKREEWPAIRESIKRRITESFGSPGAPLPEDKAAFTEVARYEAHGLTHVAVRYHVIGDEWNEGVYVIPPGASPASPAPAVLTCHGSNGELGKYGMLDPVRLPDRAYAIELAQRGYVTFSVDQFGFGEKVKETGQDRLYAQFYEKHPDWSLTGRRILAHQRALDVLEQLDIVDRRALSVMGHSLGGYAALCLTALDERIAAAVTSAGVSPNLYNVYRAITIQKLAEPRFVAQVAERRGRMPWDKHEMIALCAPRALLVIEPYNDPYNPYVLPTFESVAQGAKVYELLGVPEKISTYIHGDGHNTIAQTREIAYRWVDRFAGARSAS